MGGARGAAGVAGEADEGHVTGHGLAIGDTDRAGQNVYAAASVPAYDATGNGNYVIVTHSNGYKTYYAQRTAAMPCLPAIRTGIFRLVTTRPVSPFPAYR